MPGVPSISETRVQVELKNRFQVFQDTLHHEPCEDQCVHANRLRFIKKIRWPQLK